MKKQPVIALRLHTGDVTVNGERIKMKLPKGCIGITFAFESKKAARDYWGKKVSLVRIEKETKKVTALNDPVHFHEDSWYFWNETWSDREGPYPTEQAARDALDWYCRYILGDEK